MRRRRSSAWLGFVACVVAASAASAEGIPIGGRVLVPGGAALPRAEVRLVPRLGPSAELRGSLEGTAPEPAARALADDEGRFRLVAPHAGLWTVRVESPGFAPLAYELVPLIEPVELPDAELSADGGLTVRVKDGAGAPVAGATVLVRTDSSRFFGIRRARWSIPPRSGVTGADGSLRLAKGERERVTVSASAAGMTHAELRGRTGTAAGLTLGAGRPAPIAVRGAGGRPAPGVLVSLGERPHPVGTTDDKGVFAARVSGSGGVPLSLAAEDGRTVSATLEAAADPAEPKPRRLTLPTLLSATGRLLDADSRRPIAGGLVWDAENPTDAFVTDGSGRYAIEAREGRRFELTAGAPGYLGDERQPFQLVADGRGAPAIALRPAAAIEGKVVDAEGSPIAGAEIEIEVKRNPGMMRIEFGRPTALPRNRSDTRGAFRLSPLDPEQRYAVKVEAEGFAPAEEAVSELEPYRTRKGLRIVLDRGRTVTGRLVDADGGAIRDGRVELKAAASRRMGMVRMMEGGPGPTIAGTSDGEGRFAIAGVPDGTFDLEAKRRGFATRKVAGVEVTEERDTVDVGDVVLEPGERIQGIAVDRTGAPVEGVEVTARAAGGPMMVMMGPGGDPDVSPDAVTDPSGWFTIDDLAPGEKVSLGFQRTGYVQKTAGPFELPRVEPVEVELDPASRVVGTVLGPEEEPIPGARVNLSRSRTIEMGGAVMKTMMLMTETSDAEGRFVFDDQEPGAISLAASAEGYREAKLDGLEIPKGEDLEGIELPLEAGAVVIGQVRAPDGRPAIGARVARVGEGDGMMRMMGGVPSDGNGEYRLEGLEPGKVSVEATHPDYPRTVRDLEVEIGVNELDLDFEGGVEVDGRVVDTAGNPVANAAVRLVPAGRMWGGPEARSGRDGLFKMPGVQDGDYRVWAEAEGYAASAGEQQVNVAGEPVVGLEVRLDRGAAIYGRVRGLDPEDYGEVGVSAEGPSFLGFDGSNVDYQGSYRIENLLPGTYNVIASVAGSGRQARGQTTLEPGENEVQLDLEFGGGVTLSGRALQGETPIGGATVWAEGVDVDHDGWNETDHRGEFRIEGLEPGSYSVHLREWQSGLAYDETVELATSREIVLEVPTARIGGQVVDSADREALAGVTVTLRADETAAAGRLPLHTATTDLEGKFELANVADGSWTLTAEKKGYSAVSQPVTLQFQRPPGDVRIAMDPTEGMTLEARLPNGGVPTELSVAVLDAGGGALVGGNYATGENGRVRLSTVPPGTWDVIVSAAGSATSNVRGQAPGPPVPVSLQPACALKVIVPELAGEGVVATVRLQDAAGRPFRTLGWTGSPRSEWRLTSGEVEFRSLPPGTWSVTVSTADGRTWSGSAGTSAGTTGELRLE